MEIIDKEIKEAFDFTHNDFDAVRFTARVMKEVSNTKKIKIINKKYVFVIAAAVLLAVSVITVGAVKLIGRIIPGESDNYMVEMKLQPQTVSEDIQRQLWDYCSSKPENKIKPAYDYGKKFNSWSEASDFLGIPFLKNKLLGDALENITGGGVYLVSYADTDNKKLMYVSVNSANKVGNGNEYLYMNIGIPLTLEAADASDIINLGNVNANISEKSAEYENYISENGIDASISIITEQISSENTDINIFRVSAYFINNGLGYTITTALYDYEGTKTDAIATVKNVINGFYY